jgi:glycosyltransferase involved in cell wall biosynthesis
MRRPLIYDITRLITRVIARTPNGIDRVDYAFADYVLRNADARRSGVMMTPLGPRVISPLAAREVIDNIRKHWGEETDPESDEHCLAVSAAIGGTFCPTPNMSGPRRGQYVEAVCWIRRHGIPLGESPVKFLSGGGVYLNVSQFPMGLESYFRWLDGKQTIDGVFFIHDLLPLETPEFFRPAERPRHLRRLGTLARYGQAAIVSTSITREALLRQLAAMGRPDMPVLVAPLPPEPTFAAASKRGDEMGRHPYFVMVGTIEPRKNHLLMLQVWRELVGQFGQSTPKLLLIGERGWENEQVVDLLERCPALQGHVVRASGLATPSVKRFVLGSRALLMPSFAEGYGLPVVEAIAAGVPVIASDIPVFREIGHGRLTMIDPTDGPAWRDAICRYWREEPAKGTHPAHLPVPDWGSFFAKIEAWLDDLAGGWRPPADPT